MSLLLDTKYLHLISPRLERFRKTGDNAYNCRCPICGDSQRDKRKTRGYFLKNRKIDGLFFFCHNCNASKSFRNFLKDFDRMLFQEYQKELLSNEKRITFTKKKKEVKYKFENKKAKSLVDNENFFRFLLSFDEMPESKRQYWIDRQIPKDARRYIYYTPAFKEFTNLALKRKYFTDEQLRFDYPRFIIPFFDENRRVFGYQGRELPGTKSGAKYITIKFDDDYPKAFGLDRIDRTKPIFIVEGPIDSLFLKNAIAASGGDLLSVALRIQPKKEIYIFDNEPRSKETTEKMKKVIEAGKSIVIFPSSIKEKDINDMVISGVDVQKVIDENIYEGLAAKITMAKWIKI